MLSPNPLCRRPKLAMKDARQIKKSQIVQIKCNQDWVSLFEIKDSNFRGASLGLYSLREIPKGTLIGIYLGELIPRNKEDSTTKYCMQLPNNGDFIDPGADPAAVKDESRQVVYFGFQFLNDPNYVDSDDDGNGDNDGDNKDDNEAVTLPNVEIDGKLYVRTLTHIHIGDELLLDYHKKK